jgi:tetratricopeptide (TPR) repeat protein
MSRRPLLVMLLLVAAAGWTRGAAAQDARFDEANQLYQKGDYQGALEHYRQILADGWEAPALYYNMGNAYFKLNQLGRAILFYERAKRLAPRDDDVRANLQLARSLTTDDITPLPGFWPFQVAAWWVGLLPRSALVVVVALAYLGTMTCLVLLAVRVPPSLAAWARRLAISGAVVTVVFGANLAVRELGIGRADEAIVLAPEVKVQSAPSDDASLQIFTIHEGTKVRIDRASDEWLEVALEDGKVGWVKNDAVERI